MAIYPWKLNYANVWTNGTDRAPWNSLAMSGGVLVLSWVDSGRTCGPGGKTVHGYPLARSEEPMQHQYGSMAVGIGLASLLAEANRLTLEC